MAGTDCDLENRSYQSLPFRNQACPDHDQASQKDIGSLLIEFAFFVLPKKWFHVNRQRQPRFFLFVQFSFNFFGVLKSCVSNKVFEALLQNFFPPFDAFTFGFNFLHFFSIRFCNLRAFASSSLAEISSESTLLYS